METKHSYQWIAPICCARPLLMPAKQSYCTTTGLCSRGVTGCAMLMCAHQLRLTGAARARLQLPAVCASYYLARSALDASRRDPGVQAKAAGSTTSFCVSCSRSTGMEAGQCTSFDAIIRRPAHGSANCNQQRNEITSDESVLRMCYAAARGGPGARKSQAGVDVSAVRLSQHGGAWLRSRRRCSGALPKPCSPSACLRPSTPCPSSCGCATLEAPACSSASRCSHPTV